MRQLAFIWEEIGALENDVTQLLCPSGLSGCCVGNAMKGVNDKVGGQLGGCCRSLGRERGGLDHSAGRRESWTGLQHVWGQSPQGSLRDCTRVRARGTQGWPPGFVSSGS